tara:strand:- start:1849 stop:2403 length:555 start_codon:yes stop_codon:yes gene_type:complete
MDQINKRIYSMKKMNKNGFTLIELLVVVAIIGILAAVGVVAFQGFLGDAKINSTKSNHKAIVSFLKAELTKCSLGKTAMVLNGATGAVLGETGAGACSKTLDATMCTAFKVHFDYNGFKNPYTGAAAIITEAPTTNQEQGFTRLNCGGNIADITTWINNSQAADASTGAAEVAAEVLTARISKE